jgi:hypothetical protein
MSKVIRLNAIEAELTTYPNGQRRVKAQTQNPGELIGIRSALELGHFDYLSPWQHQSLCWLLDKLQGRPEQTIDRSAIDGIDRDRLEEMLTKVNESIGCSYAHAALIERDETQVGKASAIGQMIYELAYGLRNDLIELEQTGKLPAQAEERYGMLQSKMRLADCIIDKGTLLDKEG